VWVAVICFDVPFQNGDDFVVNLDGIAKNNKCF
jgi:hypothetical protein